MSLSLGSKITVTELMTKQPTATPGDRRRDSDTTLNYTKLHTPKMEGEMKEKESLIYLANTICQVYTKTVLIHKKLP